jgi:hypothetical protein
MAFVKRDRVRFTIESELQSKSEICSSVGKCIEIKSHGYTLSQYRSKSHYDSLRSVAWVQHMQ